MPETIASEEQAGVGVPQLSGRKRKRQTHPACRKSDGLPGINHANRIVSSRNVNRSSSATDVLLNLQFPLIQSGAKERCSWECSLSRRIGATRHH